MSHESFSRSISDFPHSYWHTYPIPHHPPMDSDETTEVAVIGAGIIGIMTAYLLTKAGKRVTLIEAREVLSGVTGNTTAKISAQHALIYDELIQTFGKEKARLYFDANMDGLHLIQEVAAELNIDCDLEPKKAVLYATSEKGVQKIRKEVRAYQQLEIPGRFSMGPLQDLPFKTLAALTMPDQAQFHPVKFLVPLLDAIVASGGKIYERTRAVKCQHATNIEMENGTVLKADKVVVATHFPFNDFKGFYFAKLEIKRSYGIAANVAGPIPDGMYISVEEPTRSLRSLPNGQLLIGGDGHPTGKSNEDTQSHYQNLVAFGQEHFGLTDVMNHWSAQDMTTLDKMPYIGEMTKRTPDISVATGFNKWGMAAGAIAGKVLSDAILGNENSYTRLFDPTRPKLKLKDMQQFTKKNLAVGKDLLVSKAKRPDKTPEELAVDEGGLLSFNGQKLGGYRDKKGKLHLVKTTCTHLGCGLNWNDAERSWDCPCHGSRFSYEGAVLNGPAVKPLERVESSE
ncbi:FAD-dependent oxidoreductase [Jeotgalibaca porci]|uniref:FAD-dependent oxidoreductase n=1 Tax=Jeotgalibaca porci TaxID=1868793 RepID=UPI00359FCFD1